MTAPSMSRKRPVTKGGSPHAHKRRQGRAPPRPWSRKCRNAPAQKSVSRSIRDGRSDGHLLAIGRSFSNWLRTNSFFCLKISLLSAVIRRGGCGIGRLCRGGRGYGGAPGAFVAGAAGLRHGHPCFTHLLLSLAQVTDDIGRGRKAGLSKYFAPSSCERTVACASGPSLRQPSGTGP